MKLYTNSGKRLALSSITRYNDDIVIDGSEFMIENDLCGYEILTPVSHIYFTSNKGKRIFGAILNDKVGDNFRLGKVMLGHDIYIVNVDLLNGRPFYHIFKINKINKRENKIHVGVRMCGHKEYIMKTKYKYFIVNNTSHEYSYHEHINYPFAFNRSISDRHVTHAANIIEINDDGTAEATVGMYSKIKKYFIEGTTKNIMGKIQGDNFITYVGTKMYKFPLVNKVLKAPKRGR